MGGDGAVYDGLTVVDLDVVVDVVDVAEVREADAVGGCVRLSSSCA